MFGRNVVSNKFALAQALVELGGQERQLVRLEELADPFSRHICGQIARVDT